MKELFKRTVNWLIWLCVLGILLGCEMIVWPGQSLTVFGILAAVYLIITGFALIIIDIKAWRMYIPFDGFLPGVLNVVLGILFICNPDFFSVYVGVAFGLWILVSAFAGIKFAVKLRGTGAPWGLLVILQIVNILAGALMVYSPVAASFSLTIVLGIVLIIRAVTNLVSLLSVKKNAKEVEQLIVETVSAFKAAAKPVAEVEAEATDAE